VVGYLRSSFSLHLCERGDGRGRGGDRGGDRVGDHGGGRGRGGDRGDGLEVDEDNNVVEHKLAVFPLVHGVDNEEEHISGVIDPISSIQQPLPLVRFGCRNRVDGDNNEEGRKSEAIDR